MEEDPVNVIRAVIRESLKLCRSFLADVDEATAVLDPFPAGFPESIPFPLATFALFLGLGPALSAADSLGGELNSCKIDRLLDVS